MNNPPTLTKFTSALATACFALTSAALALDPPPDGGYPQHNTAEGENALFRLTNGFGNVAMGYRALHDVTSAKDNTALGTQVLQHSSGDDNTGVGFIALEQNKTGYDNTAIGSYAMYGNAVGVGNTACGRSALSATVGGNYNTAVGEYSLFNSTGDHNIAVGTEAGYFITGGNNNIDIGNGGVPEDDSIIRFGVQDTQLSTFIAGIYGSPVTGSSVIVNAAGKLGVAASSARFKDKIKPMGKASEAILSLMPVTFCYKHDLDPAGIPQFGLVAEDVVKVNSQLVVRDKAGKPYTVRYEAVNAMLLNEFLKEHRKVEEQGNQIIELKAMLKEQATQIQKVSAELQLRRTRPQVAVNDR